VIFWPTVRPKRLVQHIKSSEFGFKLKKTFKRKIRLVDFFLILALLIPAPLAGCLNQEKSVPGTTNPSYNQEAIRLVETIIPTLSEFLLYNQGFVNSLNKSTELPLVKEKRYYQIMRHLSNTIFDLNGRLLNLKPDPSQKPQNQKLVAALDGLTIAAKQVTEYQNDNDSAKLKNAFEKVQLSRDQLKEFVTRLPESDGKKRLTDKLNALGVVNISGKSETTYTLYLGPFVERSAALEQAKAIPGSTVTDTPPYRIIIATFKTKEEADRQAAVFQQKKYLTQISTETGYVFTVEVQSPPSITLWEEPLWETKLGWSGNSIVAVNSNGQLVVAGSSAGELVGVSPEGQPLWLNRLTTPVASLAVSGDGGVILAANYQAFVVSGSGQIAEHSPFIPSAPIVEVDASTDNAVLAARTDPKNQGRVYLLGLDGGLLPPWPSGDDVNAASMDVQPNGEHILVGSNTIQGGQLIIYTPAGERVHPSDPARPFSVPAVIDKVVLTPSGAYSIVLAGGTLYCYDNSKESLMWSKPAAGKMLARGSTTDKILIGGSGSLTAYDLVGNKLWEVQTTDCRAVLAGQDYFVLQSGLDQLEVYNFSGERQGQITAPSNISSVQLSSSGRVLVAATEDKSLYYWRLP